MTNWFLPLDNEVYKFGDGELRKLTNRGWFPCDGHVAVSENGSMDMNIISIFIHHLNRFVRKFVPREKHYVLLLDGHSSRKGIDWLDLCEENGCEVVQSPANTSHFLQPCDRLVNKKFQHTVRETRDSLCLAAITDTKSMRFKFLCGVRGFEAISLADIRKSWEETGLWPMNFDFADRWLKKGTSYANKPTWRMLDWQRLDQRRV